MEIAPKQVKQISKAIKKILLTYWDPIGIYKSGPDDEYDSYIWPIFKLLKNGAGMTQIADYLYSLEKDIAGSFPENKEQIVLAAKKLAGSKKKFK